MPLWFKRCEFLKHSRKYTSIIKLKFTKPRKLDEIRISKLSICCRWHIFYSSFSFPTEFDRTFNTGLQINLATNNKSSCKLRIEKYISSTGSFSLIYILSYQKALSIHCNNVKNVLALFWESWVFKQRDLS